MTNLDIRERHGMACRRADKNEQADVNVWEQGSHVVLDGSYDRRAMTPEQARYLATKLRRLARRIELRASAADAEASHG